MSDYPAEKPHITENATSVTTPLDALTKREIEVLGLIARGFTNADIAKALYISEHTVNDFTKKIYRKLNVHNRQAAAQILHRYGSSGQNQN